MDSRLAFKVLRDFRDFAAGQVITQADCPDGDFPWMLKVGTIAPMSAGPMPLMSTGVNPSDLMDEVESLTAAHEPLKVQNKSLRDAIEGMHATTTAALKLATERGQQLVQAVAQNGQLMDECERHRRRAKESDDELVLTRIQLAQARKKDVATGSFPSEPPAPEQAAPTPPVAEPPPVIPAPGETEKTKGVQASPAKPKK